MLFLGIAEAHAGGKALKEAGYQFDVAHTSMLMRAQKTLETVLGEIGQSDLPVNKTWRLNERHYGGLTGLNKAETAAKHGEAQVTTSNFTTVLFWDLFSFTDFSNEVILNVVKWLVAWFLLSNILLLIYY